MFKDFTIIFDKIDQQAQVDEPGRPFGDAAMLSRETLGELDELTELRRIVAEIIEPEPLSFTTT